MLARCARCQGTFTTDRYGRQTCPHCGSQLLLPDPNEPRPAEPAAPRAPPPPAGGGSAPPPPGSGWSPPPQQEAPPEPELPSPFAERSTRGFFRSFFETWKLSALDPQRFFAHVRIDQVGTAVLFGVLGSWAGGVVGGLFGLATKGAMAAQFRRLMEQFPQPSRDAADAFQQALEMIESGRFALYEVLAAPLSALLGMAVIAAVAHLFLLVVRGAARGFGATFTVVAFSYGVRLLDAVPGCGGPVAVVWQLVVIVIGLAAIHRGPVWKSAVAVFAPVVVCCCCVLFSAGSLFASLASHAAGAGGGPTTDI